MFGNSWGLFGRSWAARGPAASNDRRRKRTEDRVLHESCSTCHESPQLKRRFFQIVLFSPWQPKRVHARLSWEAFGGSGAAFGRVWGAPGRPLGRSRAAFGEPRGGPRAILGQLEEQSDIGSTSRPILRPKRVAPGCPRGGHLGGKTDEKSI